MSCQSGSCATEDILSCKIKSFKEFRNYIKRQLGAPVLCVEIADSQLDDIICDTIGDFYRYLSGEATFRDYEVFELKKGQTEYDFKGKRIAAIVDFNQRNNLLNANNLFTIERQMYGANHPLTGFQFNHSREYGFGLSSMETVMMHFKEFQNMFGTEYQVNYNEMDKKLRIYPTPKSDLWGVLEVFRYENWEKFFQHPIFKKLAVARAKKLWALHLKKYSMTLPGGGTMNGSEIYSDGMAEEEKAWEMLISESAPPMFFVG